MLCISYILLELSSFALYFIIKKRIVTFPKNYEITNEVFAKWLEPQNIHPYLGFVETPGATDKYPVSDFGFVDTKSPIQKRSDDKIIIGIFGGSVACQIAQEGGLSEIESELKKSRFFTGRKLVFLNFAIGGYKQPQQLMALNFILALGGELDIAINFDGFNEIALPVAENIPERIFPFFPRSWSLRVIAGNSIDDSYMLAVCKVIGCSEKQKELNRLFLASPLRYSVTANLFLRCFNHHMSEQIKQLRLKLLTQKINNRYIITGPAHPYNSDADMYNDLAMVWKNCSVQMSKICNANHIIYLHFLQPCQYVPNSKIMKKEESEIALCEKQPYKKPIENGYPYLREAGRRLVEQGVCFYDFTTLFANNDDVIYSDNCCHFNRRGLGILGKAIGKAIAENIEKRP